MADNVASVGDVPLPSDGLTFTGMEGSIEAEPLAMMSSCDSDLDG